MISSNYYSPAANKEHLGATRCELEKSSEQSLNNKKIYAAWLL
jgi:hypothetical protein